jgi:hypothetical protein
VAASTPLPGLCGRLRHEALTQSPIVLGLFEDQIDELVGIETPEVGPQIRSVVARTRSLPRLRLTEHVERNCDAVLAEVAVVANRARARPRRLAAGLPQLDLVRDRAAHERTDASPRSRLHLDSSLGLIAEPACEGAWPGQVHDR